MALCQRNHICFGVLPHRSGCNDSSKHLEQEMSKCEFSPIPDIPAEKPEIPHVELNSTTYLRVGLGNVTRVRESTMRDLIGLRLWSYLPSDDDLMTDPEAVAKHEELEQLVDDKMVARSVRRLGTAMQKAAGENQKLDGVCGPLERNEQAEVEASKTLDFLTEKEWLDADLEDAEKLTTHHCEVLIKRGLQKHASADCLTCAHHPKQLWSCGFIS